MMFDVLVGVGVCFLVLLLSWGYARAIRAGQPLTTTQKKIIFYFFVFLVGTTSLEALGGFRGWQPRLVLTLIALWGLGVVGFAVWKYCTRSGS